MISRKQFSRSRNGCLQCRGRHQKCDEQKPICSLCAARQVDCEYPSDRKWVQRSGPVISRHKPRERRRGSRCGDQALIGIYPALEIASFDNEIDRIAWEYYVHTVSPHIPAVDGPENPYREVSIIALSFPVLLHTIICIASEHMLNSGLASVSRAALHKEQMLKSIDQTLKKIHGNDLTQKGSTRCGLQGDHSAFLAAIVLQGVMVALTNNEIPEPHIFYALSLMYPLQLLHDIPQTTILRMAMQRFAIMDVTVSISRQRRPRAPRDFILYQPSQYWDESGPSFHKMTGCPQPLMCFLVRILHLANDLDEGWERGRAPEFPEFSEAITLRNKLQSWWSSYTGFERSCSPREPLDLLTECYFRAAELLLARRVFQHPTTSLVVQNIVRLCFGVMSRLPAGCGTDSSLPQPFYLTAREALSSTDRDWVRDRHSEMGRYYREQQRNTAMNHIERIWQTVDTFLADPIEVEAFGILDARIKSLDRSSTVFIF